MQGLIRTRAKRALPHRRAWRVFKTRVYALGNAHRSRGGAMLANRDLMHRDDRRLVGAIFAEFAQLSFSKRPHRALTAPAIGRKERIPKRIIPAQHQAI
ncbi:hypothetical protein D3C85_1509940 [compost metagenome]